MAAFPQDDTIPHEVASLVIKKEYNLLKAWRIYLGLKQVEVAKKAGITQVSQMEGDSYTRKTGRRHGYIY